MMMEERGERSNRISSARRRRPPHLCLAIIRAKFRHEDLNIRHFRCLPLVRLFIRYRRPSYEAEPSLSSFLSDPYVVI